MTTSSPGWYQNPADPSGQLHWWDGQAWGEPAAGSATAHFDRAVAFRDRKVSNSEMLQGYAQVAIAEAIHRLAAALERLSVPGTAGPPIPPTSR